MLYWNKRLKKELIKISKQDANKEIIDKVNNNIDYLNDKLTGIKRELRKDVPYRLEENKKYMKEDEWIRGAVFGGREKGITTKDLEAFLNIEKNSIKNKTNT